MEKKLMKFREMLRVLPIVFYLCLGIEIFERLSWYAFFAVAPLYLTGSQAEGALGFSQVEKGWVMGLVPALVYFLTLFGGSLGDRFGFKKVLLAAFAILSVGYYLLGQAQSFAGVILTFSLVAVGAGLFKPMMVGTVARVTNKETSSLGFGLFYMVVNIGGFLAPFVAAIARYYHWKWVFIVSATCMALMFFFALFFYKEPRQREGSQKQSLKQTFAGIGTVLKDWRMTLFLLILTGFWSMYNQVFNTLPNYIEQWVDTTSLSVALGHLNWLPELVRPMFYKDGQIKPELIISFNPGTIVVLMAAIAFLTRKSRILKVMVFGLLLSIIGVALPAQQSIGMVIFGVVVFSIGEMLTSPKMNEYASRLAPAGKEGMYQGVMFLSVCGGFLIGGIVMSGYMYEKISDKLTLLKGYLSSFSGLPIEAYAGKSFDIAKVNEILTTQYGQNISQVNDLLWQQHAPWQIWLWFAGFGLLTLIALLLYNRFVPQMKERED